MLEMVDDVISCCVYLSKVGFYDEINQDYWVDSCTDPSCYCSHIAAHTPIHIKLALEDGNIVVAIPSSSFLLMIFQYSLLVVRVFGRVHLNREPIRAFLPYRPPMPINIDSP